MATPGARAIPQKNTNPGSRLPIAQVPPEASPMTTDLIARRAHRDLERPSPVVFAQFAAIKSCRAAMLHPAAPRHLELLISIERVTNKVFLLSPVNVDVGDQARAQVAQDGFFNQS